MSMGDEVTAVTLNIGQHLSTATIDIIAKLVSTITQITQEKIRTDIMSQRSGVTSRNIDMPGGEVNLAELVKNAKANRDTVIPINDGLTEKDRQYVMASAKKMHLPVAFEKKNDLYYPVIKGTDKGMYKHICTNLIRDKLANNSNKEFTNIGLEEWQVPFFNSVFNKYNVSAQFGQTANGQNFCLYRTEDKAIVNLALNELKKIHNEVKVIEITDKPDDDLITITDKNGHKLDIIKSQMPNHNEMTDLIEKTFNFDGCKSQMLASRLGENYLLDDEKKNFFNQENIKSYFSSIQTDCVLDGESVLVKPFSCHRVKPKTDEIPKIIYMNEKSDYVILYPEKMNNKRMKTLISNELNIKDERILDALVAKARAVQLYYNSLENSENKNYKYSLEKVSDYTGKDLITSVNNSIIRNDKDTFTVTVSFIGQDENSIEKSNPLLLSLTDKASAMEKLKLTYMEQGIGENTALRMAKECIKRANNQSADKVVQIEAVRAEKYFDSDISKVKTAELDLAMGDKHKLISLADEAKAKADIMDAFGIDEEAAEATIQTGARDMSEKQMSKLQEFGYDTNKLDVYDADYLLDRISSNKWKVPPDIRPSVYVPKAESVKVPEIELPEIELPEFSRGGM